MLKLEDQRDHQLDIEKNTLYGQILSLGTEDHISALAMCISKATKMRAEMTAAAPHSTYIKIENFWTIKLSDKILSESLFVRNVLMSESFFVRKF